MSKNKKKNKVKISSTTTDLEISKVIKILVGVLLVLVLTYFIAALMTGNIKFGKKEKAEEKEVLIQYEEILAGETFKQDKDEYYVMYFNFTDNVSSSYLTFKDTYSYKENSLDFYIVDLEKGFNQEFIKKENSEYKQNPTSIEDVKVTNPTILKISNHKVVEQIEGKEEVLKYLTEITK